MERAAWTVPWCGASMIATGLHHTVVCTLRQRGPSGSRKAARAEAPQRRGRRGAPLRLRSRVRRPSSDVARRARTAHATAEQDPRVTTRDEFDGRKCVIKKKLSGEGIHSSLSLSVLSFPRFYLLTWESSY